MDEQNVGGDRVEGAIGDDARNIVTGKDIDQHIQEVHVPVTINVPKEPRRRQQPQRSLSLELEQEFRARFDKISEKLEANTVAVTRLEGTLDKSNILHQTQIETLKSNQKSLEELAKDTDAKIVKTLAGLHLVAAPPEAPTPERDWMVPARLVFQALTALSALGLLAYFVMGGGG